jgi:hypothetical protein
MNADLMSNHLRDIQGIDTVGPWPLAPGWWLLLALMLVILGLVWRWWTYWRLMPRGSWQRDANQQIRQLRKRLNQEATKTLAADMSELLRRIAMARHGRDPCAGLSGDEWLDWLERHDPKGFGWHQHGQVLVSLPYAPPDDRHQGDLPQLLDAMQAWVLEEHPRRRAT